MTNIYAQTIAYLSGGSEYPLLDPIECVQEELQAAGASFRAFELAQGHGAAWLNAYQVVALRPAEEVYAHIH